MIISMTGFGSSEAQIENKSYSLSLRSVNSKAADLNFRIPSFLREKENEFRSKLIESLKRGKVDLSISVENGSGESDFEINSSVLLNYMSQMKEITKEMDDLEDDDILSIVSRFPNVVSSEKANINENVWSEIMVMLDKSISELLEFRKQEGIELEKDFVIRIDSIKSLTVKIKSLEGERKEKTVERLRSQLDQLVSNESVNEDRFEQEMIYYLEKLDITEELVRLDAHLKLFKETMGGNSSEGKKLGFISQEIGREINTIGSKANHAEIQRLVVEMKDELEKIKEQLHNVL